MGGGNALVAANLDLLARFAHVSVLLRVSANVDWMFLESETVSDEVAASRLTQIPGSGGRE